MPTPNEAAPPPCSSLGGWATNRTPHWATNPSGKYQGVVTDPYGEPLIGANVSFKSFPSIGTVTDLDGRYSLTVPEGATDLVVNYVGFASKELPISQTIQRIALAEEASWSVVTVADNSGC